MPLAEPTNCWTNAEQKFADAVCNSAAFQSLVGESSAEAAADKVFGVRLTHPRSGRVWTPDELATLGSHGRLFSSANAPFGKHLNPTGSYCHLPHGMMAFEINRFVPESELVPNVFGSDDHNGLTDEHDRDFLNIVGTIADQVIEWLRENGGPFPLPGYEAEAWMESKADSQKQQGMFQVCLLSFPWGRAS